MVGQVAVKVRHQILTSNTISVRDRTGSQEWAKWTVKVRRQILKGNTIYDGDRTTIEKGKVPLEDLIYTSCTDPIPQPAAARTPTLHQPSAFTHLFYVYEGSTRRFDLYIVYRPDPATSSYENSYTPPALEFHSLVLRLSFQPDADDLLCVLNNCLKFPVQSNV
ncbi:pentatricopeptide repeat-containing protein-like [Dorcoceras hygrometricum]|uniref:Pentatricopeptide repeat-containing protein-like n=1 Tax=Dorcoceras hygrometricum TaxID=472368 RepID=A0A2Z7CHW2_9LAMI|nr:pentatricopeptide repeat-containing protein-like [Dorcoceras hygrometricum]